MENEKLIWNMLMEAIGNPYGVAGLMGNLKAESSLNPYCKTGGKTYRQLSGEEYAKRVMNGDISKDSFSHDGAAFGLAQWCYWSRKEALYDFAMKEKLDIGSVQTQVRYMLKELPKYRSVWKTLQETSSVAEASDIVLLRYEKPANTSDKVKAKRALYSEEFFEKYAGNVVQRLSTAELLDILTEIEHEEQFVSVSLHDKLLMAMAELEDRIAEELKLC